MTGFIRGLFGGKARNPGESDRPVRAERKVERKVKPPAQQNGGAFYLNPDDAKTYGDIDYMRTVKTVRRTFAKKRGEMGEKESIKQVSAMDSVRMAENGLAMPKPAQSETTFQPAPKQQTTTFNRRGTDTNLDMFRKMAKDMKK
jgi:hypothetical protein